MSDVIEIQRLRGNESDKAASTRVLPVGQTAVVLDEAYHVLGDGVTELKDLRPMEDRRIDTVNDTDGPLVIDNVSPSIIACDTADGEVSVTLPDLASNQGRKLYIINVNAANSIEITASGGDGIGAALESSITVTADVTTTILIAHASYWEQVATGGGSGEGGGMEIGTIYPYAGTAAPIGSLLCDGSAISRTEYADLFAAIGETWGSGDGSTTFNVPDLRGAFVRGTGSHGSETMADGSAFAGPSVGSFEDDQMQGHRHAQLQNRGETAGNLYSIAIGDSPVATSLDVGAGDPSSDTTNGTPRTGDETRPFAAGVTYCIKATPATNSGTPLPTYSYSTGWVANSDWTNAEFTVTHGLNANLSDLIVEFLVSSDGTEANAFKVTPQFAYDNATSSNTSAGITTLQINTSAIKLQTGVDGIGYIQSSGTRTFIDTESWYYKVKVYRPEVLATELSVTKYDTGWVANSDWANAEFNITHNLGVPLPELITRFFISTDGTDANAFEINAESYVPTSLPGSTTSYGLTTFAISDASFKIQTGAQGLVYMNDSGAVQSIITSSWYYRVVVYAPNLLENVTPAAVKSVSTDYTITGRTDSLMIQVTTGATDRTITLPAGTGMIPGDEIEVDKDDSGTGKVILAAAGADTIDGVASVDIDSQDDYARVRWTGSRWRLVEYKDHGNNATGSWTRYADGTMKQRHAFVTDGTDGITDWTFPKAYPSGEAPVCSGIENRQSSAPSGDVVVTMGSPTNTKVTVRTYNPRTDLAVLNGEADVTAEGRWRA
jgi:microcystin-dependent protein